jgi:hypothetical protein
MQNDVSATIVLIVDETDVGGNLRVLVHRRIRQLRPAPHAIPLLFRQSERARA